VTVVVRRLAPGDDRTNFASGNIELDRFLARYAGQNQFRHHIGATYVAVEGGGPILGYATVAASEMAVASLAPSLRKSLPAYPLPVLRLARLAVRRDRRGEGIGSTLLRAVFALAHGMAADFGCVGVVVDAKPEAVAFYRRLGFIALDARAGALGARPEPLPMFLELGAIPKAD
jgi:GNAT superfamily N-acetyltransferase